MVNKKLVFSLFLSFFAAFCQAGTAEDSRFQHPFYVGGMGGYGSTTWEGLVPTEENQNQAINMSTPVKVTEGGGFWGVFAGYELIPTFALETSYMRYPDARIIFDSLSLFSFNHNDKTEFNTRTETVNLMGKVMLFIPHTNIRAYSSAGAAGVHRSDILNDKWRLTPTFGVGLNYRLTNHLMAELGGNYTAGFGESQLDPTNTYFPFLYSVFLRLAYCF